MPTNISQSPLETEKLGEAWAKALTPGTVIGLNGPLGAGKTQLVRGLARGMGFAGRIQSPTFTLINIYSTPCGPLYHLDLYRLESDEEVLGAGLDEYFEPDGIAVIEWMERWTGPAPSRFRDVRIESGKGDTRTIHHDDSGF